MLIMRIPPLFVLTTFATLAFAHATFAKASANAYVLFPKQNAITSFMNTQEAYTFYTGVALQFGLNEIANFDRQMPFYTVSHDTVVANRKTLSEVYEIEENRRITLNDAVLGGDQGVWLSSDRQNTDREVPWHLARVTQKKLPLGDKFPYAEAGSCHRNNATIINTYIVDTGIDITHPEFEGRASWAANFADDLDTDCNNHGTHVAGLVGSRSYGVCVDAKLFAVKVLDCEGSGSLSGVVQGIEWVYKQHLAQKRASVRSDGDNAQVIKSLINMSLGGGYSPAINRAVETCVKNEDHFYIVVAAGNEDSDSCRVSPASVKNILTVMASDKDDKRAWFSNWGSCSNVYSPGVDVLSTIPGGKRATYSGTSMASPVMAGVLNHYLDMFPEQNMGQMMKTVAKLATKDTIEGEKPKTVNLLAYLRR
jgi:hypothetical protein